MADKVLLVTGGGRGIGAAISRLAAKDGWDVAINYAARPEPAEEVAAAVRAAGRKAVTIKGDVSDHATVVRMFDEAEQALSKLTGVVVNAGIINKSAPLAEIPVEDIQRVIEVDLMGAIWTAREAVRRMGRSYGGQGGVIVNISSMAAIFCGAGGFAPYGIAKLGVDAITEGLGKDVAGDGIRVCGLRPGLIDTDIQNDTGIENRLERFGPTVPMGRTGTADEVAEAAVWLLSEKASYVTATSFNVSGGR
ncbi:SDR family oxidoreductase [Geminicoccus roseus]|uniref:SDR family oxidoreductase n=1 Tax=Geminicoccus roseus TaxID=404900 RepID=UPI0004886374|nr:SDR family oxidoreductase [Geminicoccus roseus]